MNKAFAGTEGFVHVVFDGSQTTDEIEWTVEKASTLARTLRARREPVRVLADLARIGAATREARARAERLLLSFDADRVAVCGLGTIQAALANLGISRKRPRAETRFFARRETAIAWLGPQPTGGFPALGRATA